ncbi:MAG: hypothetical protein PWQ57_2440 [Desulfovibrionales bacterium]|jgi:hypothetical protein|nr:hypothetical protein [Desulfovibrionales bacterium]
MAPRFFAVLILLVLTFPLSGCGTESRASDDRPAAFYVIAAPSGREKTCRAQAELLQRVLLSAMRPGDSLRFAVGRKDVADFAFAPDVELASAARQDKIRPGWARVKQHYQAAAQFEGPDRPLDVAAVLPQAADWAEARPKALKIIVLVGQPGEVPQLAPSPREQAALQGAVVHMIQPTGELSPEELHRGRSEWERFFAARGARLMTYSANPSACERLRPELAASLMAEAPRSATSEIETAPAQPSMAAKESEPASSESVLPETVAAESSPRQWRVRIRWQDRSSDYDLHVLQELGGVTHRSTSANSHQRHRLPSNWEEVELTAVSGAELVELIHCAGPADPGLKVEVRDPSGRLLQATDVGFLFRDARGSGRNPDRKTVVMMDLLPQR